MKTRFEIKLWFLSVFEKISALFVLFLKQDEEINKVVSQQKRLDRVTQAYKNV